MASAPSASWNSRCITHLANCPNRSSPTNCSDESEKRARHWLQRVSHRERHEAYNLSSHLFADRTTEVEFRREGVWAGCCPWHDLRKAALSCRRGRDNHRASCHWLQRVSHRERHEAYTLSSHLFADRTTEVEFRREGVWAGCCPWHDLRKAALSCRRGRDNHRASSDPYLWRMGQEPRRSDVPESRDGS